MSSYEFRCPDCKKVIHTESTGEVPKEGEFVECIFCGRISTIIDNFVTLEVAITSNKKHPSQLEELNLNEVKKK